MKNFLIFMVLIVVLVNKICAGTIDPNTPDSKYIEYGSKFNHVVKLCCFDGKGLSCGSAVVIDPHWVVTAAHVVENCQTWTITANDKEYKLSKMILNPNYKTDNFGYDDIALGYSENAINFDFYPKLYESNDEVGKICSLAGWGLTGTFYTGIERSDNKRRGGSNFVDGIERNVLMCSPSKRNEKYTELEYLIGSGDSGGGLFINGKLAGIHSSVVAVDGKPNSTYRDESCHTRVSKYVSWIKSTMRECSVEK